MAERKGTISVQTADIFPIIKKWLYSEHDIFIRELVSNATDAITKRRTIARTSGQELPEPKIDVRVNSEEKTIRIIDNGLGMTEEEVEKYIAQLAFSGAEEFVKKMEKVEGEEADVIGKFGLGFYSAFMVADKVEVRSLSMNEGAKAVHWACEGDTDYTFSDGDKAEVGTEIILHINEESKEFLGEWKLTQTLRHFCDFMPYPISILDENRKPEKPLKDDGTVDEEAPAVAVQPSIINETKPLWKRDPKEIKDDEYKEFYRKLFPGDPDPLFWLHLRIDHPFTLEGILFFPKFNPHKAPFNERNIRLYQKQVFVSDNVKNVIPEFLAMLKGTIDSPDIPLNVSRSALQGDPNIRKISNYVVKKVAESLKKLFKSDRARFEEIWPDIGIFAKYGCISDEKFDEIMRSMILFPSKEKKLSTLGDYRERIPADYKEKLGDKILYYEKEKADYSLIKQIEAEGLEAFETDDQIDPHFLQHVEMNKKGEEEYKFVGLDSEIDQLLADGETSPDDIKIKDLFKKFMGEKEVEVARVKNAATPAYFKSDESMKRFAKMAQSMGQDSSHFAEKKTLVVNPSNALIQNAMKIFEKGGKEDLVGKICHHVEDLAQISSNGLAADEKDLFVARSQKLIQELSSLAL